MKLGISPLFLRLPHCVKGGSVLPFTCPKIMIFLPAKQSSGGSSLSVGLTDRENHHVSCSEVLSKTPSIFIISYSIKSPEE
jgi:hypothetical protein